MPALRLLTQQQCTDAIARHSAALADVADGNLDADVEFCPGWSVRDLVHHITQVQWFWATIVQDGLTERPDQLGERPRAPDETAVAELRRESERLVRVLTAADPTSPVWTWAPTEQNAGFVVRHQVQEVVGHHWDAAHAAGQGVEIRPEVGADSVDEFLHFSVSNPDDHDDPLPAPLDGRLGFVCTDSDAAWLVADADPPGTAVPTHTSAAALAAEGVAAVRGTGGQLLLWLYDRHGDPAGDADADAVDPALRQRFREISYTD